MHIYIGRLSAALTAVWFVSRVPAYSEELGLSVSKGEEVMNGQIVDHYDGGVKVGSDRTYIKVMKLKITAKADKITLSSIEGNRGNCQIIADRVLPANLKFGDTIQAFPQHCDPLEVAIDTSNGVLSFSWPE